MCMVCAWSSKHVDGVDLLCERYGFRGNGRTVHSECVLVRLFRIP
jgi:hypothetical protein